MRRSGQSVVLSFLVGGVNRESSKKRKLFIWGEKGCSGGLGGLAVGGIRRPRPRFGLLRKKG